MMTAGKEVELLCPNISNGRAWDTFGNGNKDQAWI